VIEVVVAASSGVAGFALCYAYWHFLRIRKLPQGMWVAPLLLRETHEHEPHIAGTLLVGGVKHKQMFCTKCQKRWVEKI
jgi:hypothetical protein